MFSLTEIASCEKKAPFATIALGLAAIGTILLVSGATFWLTPTLAMDLALLVSPDKQLGQKTLRLLADLPRQLFILGSWSLSLSIILVVFSTRGECLSSRLRRVLYPTCLAMFFGCLTLDYFQSATCLTGDADGHVARAYLTFEALGSGGALTWTNRWYCGYPFLRFDGPLLIGIIGLANFLVKDIFVTTKLVLWVLHVLSGIVMYFCLQKMLTNPRAAAVGSLAYVASPLHFSLISGSGALPLSLEYVLFPCLFWNFEKFRRGELSTMMACLVSGLTVAGLVFGHVQYGALAAVSFALAIAVGCRASSSCSYSRTISEYILFLLGTAAVAGLLTLWILVYLVNGEMGEVLLGNSSGLLLSWPSLDRLPILQKLFLWNRGWSSWEIKYAGISILLFALVGVVGFFRERDPNLRGAARPLIAGLAIGFVMTALNFRASSFWLFYLAALSAFGVNYVGCLWNKKSRSHRGMIFILAWTLIMIDTAPGLLHIQGRGYEPFWSESAVPKSEIILSSIQERAGRYLALTRDHRGLWSSLETIALGQDMLFGNAPHDATLSYPYAAAITMRAAQEYYDEDEDFSEATLDGFFLLNVKYIFFPEDGSDQNRAPAEESLLTLPSASPLLFARDLEAIELISPEVMKETWYSASTKFRDRELNWRFPHRVIRGMEIDRSANTAKRIFVREKERSLSNNSDTVSPSLDLGAFDLISNKETRAEFYVNQDGFVRLAYSYYPYLRIFLDGMETPYYRTAMNFVVFPVKGGYHTVEVSYGFGFVNSVLFFVFLITLGAIVLFFVIRFSQSFSTKRN